MLNRRKLLAGLGIGLAAPTIIRTPGLLMPVRTVPNLHDLRIIMQLEPVRDSLFYVVQNGQPVYTRMSDVMRYIQG